MALEGNMDYAAARIHARLGQLPDEATWRRIESSRDLPHYLHAVRASSLSDWVAGIDLSNDAHTIERTLRLQWRHHVQELARWHPREWQRWIAWTGWLPLLTVLAELSRSRPPPAWMLADPTLGAVASGSPSERAAGLIRIGAAALASALLNRTSIGAAWMRQWQQLLPPGNLETGSHWKALRRAMDQHARELQTGDSGTPARTRLRERLQQLFRRTEGSAIASVCYVGLLALHLERLRGGMVLRKLFPSDAGALQ